MAKFPVADLYGVTDSHLSRGRSTVEMVEQMLRAGITIIQYREKEKPSGVMLAECMQIRELTREAGCCFIVNDHVDIALLCKADGIHVGQDDLPLAAVRQLVGSNSIVGVSARSWEEAEAAIAGGADYLGVGAVFPTQTKNDAVHTGLALLEMCVRQSPIPVVAIGGINAQTIGIASQTGARCFAIISALTLAEDIPAQAAILRSAIQKGAMNAYFC